jgi:pyrroloquinoline quinone biosynthesis protein B
VIKKFVLIIFLFVVSIKLQSQNNHQYLTKRPYAVVLGTTQDGGYPHAGCEKQCCKNAWSSDSLRKMVSSIAIIDPRSGLGWMIDATPDFAKQFHIVTKKHGVRLAGIFLTHAHIGHYAGLMQLGKEVMGAKNIVVYTMPKMKKYLEKNGPWNQLINLKNIVLLPMNDKK